MASLGPAARLPEHLLANAQLLPDREAILPLLPKHKVIAEIGVALGDFSARIIRDCAPEHFIAIDMFDLHTIPELWGRTTQELFGGDTHAAFYRKRFADLIAQGKVSVLEGDSAATLATLDDASLDIVYVDADHSYEPVKRELATIVRKVRDDGFIIMNDYIMTDCALSDNAYGVIQATNEFMIAENWEMIYLAFQSHMYCDVVLRKVSSTAVAMPDARTAVLLRQNAELEARIALLERTVAALRASTSWRITAPMRAIRRSLSPR
jgi:SAM-dependent methyltransferase